MPRPNGVHEKPRQRPHPTALLPCHPGGTVPAARCPQATSTSTVTSGAPTPWGNILTDLSHGCEAGWGMEGPARLAGLYAPASLAHRGLGVSGDTDPLASSGATDAFAAWRRLRTLALTISMSSAQRLGTVKPFLSSKAQPSRRISPLGSQVHGWAECGGCPTQPADDLECCQPVGQTHAGIPSGRGRRRRGGRVRR